MSSARGERQAGRVLRGVWGLNWGGVGGGVGRGVRAGGGCGDGAKAGIGGM